MVSIFDEAKAYGQIFDSITWVLPLFMQVLNRPKLEYLLVRDLYLDF